MTVIYQPYGYSISWPQPVSGLENQPHFHAMTADFINQAECLTVDSFRMQSDEISSRTCQLSNVILRTRYHQMAVERFYSPSFYLAYEEQ